MNHLTYTEITGEAGKCGEWFRWAANGNAQAEAWLWAYWNFSQMLDDLVDGDRAVSQTDAARALFDWWTQCAVNVWFANHSAAMWIPVAQSIERWVAADRWPRVTAADRAQRQVLRHGDLEVVMAVAIACGGMAHALTGQALRSFDPEEAEHPGKAGETHGSTTESDQKVRSK